MSLLLGSNEEGQVDGDGYWQSDTLTETETEMSRSDQFDTCEDHHGRGGDVENTSQHSVPQQPGEDIKDIKYHLLLTYRLKSNSVETAGD